MKLLTYISNSMRDLTEKANSLGLAKEDIVTMGPVGDGTFMLVYYGED